MVWQIQEDTLFSSILDLKFSSCVLVWRLAEVIKGVCGGILEEWDIVFFDTLCLANEGTDVCFYIFYCVVELATNLWVTAQC